MRFRNSLFSAAASAACLFSSASFAAYADSVPILTQAEVLSRYRQANLGPTHIHSSRITGTESTGGVNGSYVTIYKEGGKRLVISQVGLRHEATGSDGKTSWQLDSNGNVRLLASEEDKDQRTDQAISSSSFATAGQFSGGVTLRPQTERRTGNYILDITPADGKATTLFLDPKTFLLMREERLEDDRVTTVIYSDYKQLGGSLRPTVVRTRSGDKKYDDIATITQVENNIDVPDSLFVLPPSVKNYTWLAPGKTSVTIPFDDYDTAIKLYVGVNGVPAFIQLDSGDSDFTIAKWASDLLKLTYIGRFEARGYGGSADIRPVRLDSFELPDAIAFSGLTGTAIDMPKGFGASSATPSVGFVGYPLLSRFIVQIDYVNQDIVLSDPDTWNPTSADGTPLPLELDDNVPSVLASLDGLPPARYLVDTGDSQTVQLYGPYVAQNKLNDRYRKGMDVYGIGIGGEVKGREVRAHQFSIAGTTLQDVPIGFSQDKKGGASNVLAGAVGHQFLSHFTVTFDYPHKRIFFAPNANTQKPFDTRTFGIYMIYNPEDAGKAKRRLLIGVDPKSPAAKSGLEAGSELLAVDGQKISDLPIGEVRRLLSAEGGKVTRDLEYIGPEGGTGHMKVTMYDPLPRDDAK